MRLSSFQYHAPASLSRCAQLLERYGEEATLAAGGTDLFVRMKLGLAKKSHVISLAAVEGIDGIIIDRKGALILGAGTTLSDIARSPLVRERVPVLADSASLVATAQVRNMGTLGGNIFQETRCSYYNRSAAWRRAVAPCFKRGGDLCHVFPKGKKCFAVYQGDLAPVLIALGSTAIVTGNGKKEEMPLEGLFTGEGKSPFRESGYLLLSRVRIPLLQEGEHAAYRKYRVRKGMDYPLAGVAVKTSRKAGSVEELKVCLTGVSSAPVILSKASELARGKDLTDELTGLIADAAYKAAHPVDNLEVPASRRREMVRLMTAEMLRNM
jgi:4-hydroxybenzoyl-CoA reductase beta subunit